jgi:putative Holliday junction resolvase
MSISSQNLAKTKHILAIDYGESKVGLALADRETKIPFAYNTIENDKHLLVKIGEIIAEKNVDTVILGIPAYINRKSVEYIQEKIGKIIASEFPVKVEYQDETFTTKMAHANLIQKGVKGIKKYDDQEAARIILEGWLNRQN